MESLMVNIAGLVLMAAIVWWFWLPRSNSTRSLETKTEKRKQP